jgi:adenosylcobinamide-phosphate synthase
MNFVAILAALALEQWRTLPWRAALERAFVAYARGIERRINGGTTGQGVVATLLAILPPVLLTALLGWLAARTSPFLALAFNILVLYLLMGFRRFSHAVSAIVLALKTGDLTAARRALAQWRGGSTSEMSSQDIAKCAIECGLVDAYRQVFAVLFWFTVLPGPAGAVLYRAAALLAHEWRGETPGEDTTPIARSLTVFGRPAQQLLWLLDFVPVRLTALSFAVVGDFEDAIYCWRTQARQWPAAWGGETVGILLASGGGALGIVLGGALPTLAGEAEQRPEMGMGEPVDPDMIPSAVGLVWRALILWLLLILLLTLANLAP